MNADIHLNEIRDKIYRLRTAIMYSMSNDVCKLPNSIITALRVDEEGQLWFTCQKPLQDVAEFEESFPVRLHFYQKGIFYHLEVSGRASIVDEDYRGGQPANEHRSGRWMLVKMTMNTIEYTEPYKKREKGRLEMLVDKGYKWLARHITLSHQPKPSLQKNAFE